MGNSVLYNTAGSIALAVNFEVQGAYSDKYLTKEGDTTIRINSEFFVRVDDTVFSFEDDVDLTEEDLDAGVSFDASETYCIYACHPLDGTITPQCKISKNVTYPDGGWDAANSRKIGGFDTDGSGHVSESTLWDLRTVALDGMASDDHDATHVKDGSDEIDGDHLDIDYTPANYTPSTTPSEASDVDHLAAHLAGIDNALADVAFASGYGVRWDSVNDIMVTGVVSGGTFMQMTLENFPVHEKAVRCVMDASNVVQYYSHPDDTTLKESGEAASLDGTDGQVVVEMPQFHCIVGQRDGDYAYYLVGERPFSLTLSDDSVVGSIVHPWFWEGGTLAEVKYRGAFEVVL